MGKAKIRKTGEIVDVICFGSSLRRNLYDRVSYIDSKGVEHEEEHLNYYWDLEEISDLDATIDWEQRKFDVAKELFLSLYQESSCNTDETPTQYVTRLAIGAIRGADAFLIEYQKSITYNGK